MRPDIGADAIDRRAGSYEICSVCASCADRALAEIGVLPADFAAQFRPLARFRNVLVHGYLQVDFAIVERVLNEKIRDLERFADLVEAYIGRAE